MVFETKGKESRKNSRVVNPMIMLLEDINDKFKNNPRLKYLLCGLFASKGEYNAYLVYSALEITKPPNFDLFIEVMCTRFVVMAVFFCFSCFTQITDKPWTSDTNPNIVKEIILKPCLSVHVSDLSNWCVMF